MELRQLIPRDKFDVAAVHRADTAGSPTIDPILPDLLEWLQDGNWPVAKELIPVLAKVGPPLAPHVVSILRGDDNVWKYWILTELAIHLDCTTRDALIDECVRIVNTPTDGEIAEDVHLAARAILNLHTHC